MPTKNHILISLLLLICLFSFYEGIAQRKVYEEDVVYLKNGSIIRGEIVKQVPGEYVDIQVVSDSIFHFQNIEIDKITREPSKYLFVRAKLYKAYLPITYRKRGLYQQASVGTAFHLDRWNTPQVSLSLNYRAGYHFNQYLNVGAGTGFDIYEGGTITPFFLDIWGDLWEKPFTPTYMANIGYGYGLAGSWRHDVFNGGPLGHAAIGFKFNTRSKKEYIFTVGYKAQHTYQEFEDWEFRWGNPWGGNIDEPSVIRGTRLYQKIVWQFSFGF